MGLGFPVQLEIESIGFCTGRKTGENPRSKDENKLNPLMTAEESNPGHVGGRQVLSPQRHPYCPRADVAPANRHH